MSDSCDPMDYIARQPPLSMGFPRQAYWSRLSFPSPGHLPKPGIEPMSPPWQADSSTEPHWKLVCIIRIFKHTCISVWASQVALMVKNPPTNTYTDTHNIHVKFEVYGLLLKLVYFISFQNKWNSQNGPIE